MLNRTALWRAAAALAAIVVVGACSSAPHARTITLTFVRHAQSESNAAGVINTDVPGSGLTREGRTQARQLAHRLAREKYDGVYASTMIRTEQTAAPLAEELGEQVEVLPGLREVDAGWYEDTPTSMAELTYLVAPKDWLSGERKNAIPGSINGDEFNGQFTGAVQKIYDSGNTKPIAFSSGVSIMYWTLMNVKNPKNSLATSHPLPNTGKVVITGSPTTGWTLVDWDGIRDFSY
jgi:broad specificity phosphatase PhoE